MTEFLAEDLKLFEGHQDQKNFFTPAEQLLLLESKLHQVSFDKVRNLLTCLHVLPYVFFAGITN